MEIQEYCPTFKEGLDLGSVLISAALAAKWQEVRRGRAWQDCRGKVPWRVLACLMGSTAHEA